MSVELFTRTGKMAIGSRLRMLTSIITADANRVYELYGMPLQAKWFPVFFALIGGDEMGVTEIARVIGHSHPSVIQILKEMEKAGLVKSKADTHDKRRTLMSLTSKARKLVPTLERQFIDVQKAVEKLDAESQHSLWNAIEDWEKLLEKQSLYDRIMVEKVKRETSEVQIVDYDDKLYHDAFRKLNEQWISNLFQMEEEDHMELDHPMENIIDKGGFIYIAVYHGEAVGTFAMMKCEKPGYDWEFVKFAVNPKIQGKGIGSRLMETCIYKARILGSHKIFLETNKRCEAAVHLYEKYGFKHLPVINSPYARCDVQMELTL